MKPTASAASICVFVLAGCVTAGENSSSLGEKMVCENIHHGFKIAGPAKWRAFYVVPGDPAYAALRVTERGGRCPWTRIKGEFSYSASSAADFPSSSSERSRFRTMVPSNEIAEQIRDRLAKSGDRSEPAALRELNHKGRLHRILDYRRDVITSGFFFEYPNFVDYVAVRGKTAWVLRYITNRPELNYAAHNLDSTLADMVDGFRPVKKQPTRSIGKFSYRVPGGPNWFVCVNFTRFTPEGIQTEILMRLFEGPANGAFLLSRAPSINLARVTAGPVAETAGDAQSTIREIADDIKRFYQRGGFRDLQFSETADPALGSHCRRTEWTVERPARASLPIMDMRAKGLICVHPDDPKRIIQMLVSQRKVKGGKFPDIEKSTEGFLGGLKFLPIKKP